MKNYKIETILVPTDFSYSAGKALSQAVSLARKINSKIVVIHVVELTNYTAPLEMISLGLITEQIIEEAKKKLKDLIDGIKETNTIKIEFATYFGNVYENIIRAVHLMNAELIIMGSHGFSGFAELLFGNNVTNVINNSSIPVLTVHTLSELKDFKKILFPFNSNIDTIKKAEQVIALAKAFNSTVLLCGFSYTNENMSLMSLRDLGYDLSLMFAKENIRCMYSIKQGEDYEDMILSQARDEGADLISIVSSINNRNDSVCAINTAKVVNNSNIPVISVPVISLNEYSQNSK